MKELNLANGKMGGSSVLKYSLRRPAIVDTLDSDAIIATAREKKIKRETILNKNKVA
jgi:hypothetical protein